MALEVRQNTVFSAVNFDVFGIDSEGESRCQK